MQEIECIKKIRQTLGLSLGDCKDFYFDDPATWIERMRQRASENKAESAEVRVVNNFVIKVTSIENHEENDLGCLNVTEHSGWHLTQQPFMFSEFDLNHILSLLSDTSVSVFSKGFVGFNAIIDRIRDRDLKVQRLKFSIIQVDISDLMNMKSTLKRELKVVLGTPDDAPAFINLYSDAKYA